MSLLRVGACVCAVNLGPMTPVPTRRPGLQRHKLLAYKQRLETMIASQKEMQAANEKLERQLGAQQDTAAQRLAELKDGTGRGERAIVWVWCERGERATV